MNAVDYLSLNKEDILKTYQKLHRLAEPSWKEKETSHYIFHALTEAGLSVQTFEKHYGLIAEIPGELQEVVALRADMDALLQEVDGVMKANHSCGHDAHSTMVLHAALALAASGTKPKRTLRFIFQPAEEKAEGALQLIKDHALQDTAYLFGLHLRPEFEVPFGKASPVIVHSSSGTITGSIKGVQAHAARPEDGINAIEAAAVLIQKLKQARLDTNDSWSIKMTQLHGGAASSNIIPETADFTLDARAKTTPLLGEVKELLKKAAEETTTETGAAITWTMDDFVPAAIQNEEAISLARAAIISILGKDNLVETCVSPGGEDFHFYTLKEPGIKATMVGLGCGLTPGLHHPEMTFNQEALVYGARILAQTVLLASEQ
ncbi:amidohydrolase [Peribacillus sp. SCS-37]|uniref:amidohydrolase n=1 Tax=Paraperibacillus esterisolvens TaxID=3115296 RepID=UPI003905C526